MIIAEFVSVWMIDVARAREFDLLIPLKLRRDLFRKCYEGFITFSQQFNVKTPQSLAKIDVC